MAKKPAEDTLEILFLFFSVLNDFFLMSVQYSLNDWKTVNVTLKTSNIWLVYQKPLSEMRKNIKHLIGVS